MKYIIYFAVLTTFGCASTKNKQHGTDPESKRSQIVMVIDSDFDTSSSIFDNKIVGKYTLECSEDDSKCEIKEGFSSVPKQNQEVLSKKDIWNKAIKARDFSTISALSESGFEDKVVHSHGTSTASIIAYKNPNVKLVLVQIN